MQLKVCENFLKDERAIKIEQFHNGQANFLIDVTIRRIIEKFY